MFYYFYVLLFNLEKKKNCLQDILLQTFNNVIKQELIFSLLLS